MPVLLKNEDRDAAIRPCSNPDDTADTAVLPVGFEDSDEAQAVPDGCEPCHGLPGAYAQVPICPRCGTEKRKRKHVSGWDCPACKSGQQKQRRAKIAQEDAERLAR